MKAIKIFGLPRSCTNLCEHFLKLNLKASIITNYPCWKHGRNSYFDKSIKLENGHLCKDLKFVICSKKPIDWLWSLYQFEKKSKKQVKTIEEFLTLPAWHYPEMNPIQAYNSLMKHWFDMFEDESKLQVFKFEDFINSPNELIVNFSKQLDIELLSEEIKVPEERINPGLKVTDDFFVKNVCLFSNEQIKFINEQIDQELYNKIY